MTDELKNAYITTINDLRIALSNCGLFEFKKRRRYNELINEYENRLIYANKNK
jgi:hypothetical protein